jgi:SSS family transporter
MTGGVIIAYVVLLVLVGLYSARQVRTESDYLVAGRQLGPIVLGATLPATQMSAGTAIGTVGYIALYGYQYNWFWVALWTGWLVSMLFVAPKMHEFGRTHGGMTIPDIVGARFGRTLRFVVALIIVIAFLLLFSAEYQGAATVFNLVFGISYIPAVLISAAVVGIYSLSGGLFSVARNDMLQMVVFVVGYVAAAVYALHAVGGMSGLQHRLSTVDPQLLHVLGNSHMPLGTLIGFSIGTGVTFVAYPLDAVKFYAASKRSVLLRALTIGILLQVIIAFTLGIIGSAGRALQPNTNSATADGIAPYVALHTMPPVLAGLLMAAVIGAVMAVSSSIIMIISAAISHDIVPFVRHTPQPEKSRLRSERVVSGLVVLAGVALAVKPIGSVATIVLIVQQFMASTLAVVLIAALNWRRATVAGAGASMTAGFVGVIGWYAAGDPGGLAPVFGGLPLAVIAMIVGSLLTGSAPAPTVVDTPTPATAGSTGEAQA